jgi:hypothetical protein
MQRPGKTQYNSAFKVMSTVNCHICATKSSPSQNNCSCRTLLELRGGELKLCIRKHEIQRITIEIQKSASNLDKLAEQISVRVTDLVPVALLNCEHTQTQANFLINLLKPTMSQHF